MENAPSSSSEWYRNILDRMGEMVCRFRADGTLLYVNRAYRETLGVEGEVVGTKWAPAVHPDDLAAVEAEVATLRPERPEVEIQNRVVCADGSVLWTRWRSRGFFDEDGTLCEVQATGRDVTTHVEMKARLEASHRRLGLLADASDALASSLEYEVTLARVMRLVVPALADSCTVTLTWPTDPAQRISVTRVDLDGEQTKTRQSELGTPSPAYRELLDRALAGEVIHVSDVGDGDPARYGLDEKASGLLRPERVTAFVIVPMVARGRSIGAMSLLSSRAPSRPGWDEGDLSLFTELARRAAVAIDNAFLYRELEAEQTRKDQFLATLAHELRNPMAALAAAVESLRQPDLPSELRDKALAIAARQIRQQSRMVDDLLDVSRLTRGRVELDRGPVELQRVLQDIVDAERPLAARKEITLTVAAPEDEVVLSADPVRLQQIAGNLLDNAIKFTPRGGTVEVVLETEAETAWIEVRDRGPGLPHGLRQRVFDLFVQGPVRHERPSSGLGIGLTIAQELANLHGGRIEAREREGGGTVFTVGLPVWSAEPSSAPRDAGEASAEALDILVVDDNPDVTDTLAMLLRGWGHSVRVAYDGHAAIEAARACRPRLVLLDIGMPDLDGYETARALRALGLEDARLVALTGYSQPDDRDRAMETGFDRHVVKPVGLEVLEELIAEGQASAPTA